MPRVRIRPRSLLDRVLERETPIFTTFALLITILGETLILIDLLTVSPGWGGLAQLGLLMVVLFYGTMVNAAFAAIASMRAPLNQCSAKTTSAALRMASRAPFAS